VLERADGMPPEAMRLESGLEAADLQKADTGDKHDHKDCD
jgi:hypothetical protein